MNPKKCSPFFSFSIAPTASHPSQRIIFADTAHQNKLGELTLTPVTATYPNFTLQVKPNVFFHRENYWCELEVPDLVSVAHKPKVLASSNLWINTPILTIETERVFDGEPNHYLARCKVEHFDLVDFRTGAPINSTTVSYSVSFYIYEEGEVATFNVTKGQMEEFRPFPVSAAVKRTILGHGPNVEYPLFEVLYSAEDFKIQGYWCELVYNGPSPSVPGGRVQSKTVFSV